MNDFSFSGVFRSAFNTFVKNFTDIFLVTVFSSSAVLVMSLFLNSLFLSRLNTVMDAALTGNYFAGNADSNPFIFFSLYAGFVLLFAALAVFFMFSLLLPLCKNNAIKLRNYMPSLPAVIKFTVSAALLLATVGFIIAAVPFIAKSVSGGAGYSVGMLGVSAVSFAFMAVFVIFALRYVFFFIALLEKPGLKEALSKSRDITRNRRMKIFVLLSLLFIINFFAKYFIFLLLFTIPLSILTAVYVYLELSGFDAGTAADNNIKPA